MALTAPADPSAVTAQTRLLVVAPHPDDETIANGLLIQRVREAGGAVRVLLLTDGDNNPWPQRWLERRWSIGSAERERWGRRRRAECEEALRRLGLPSSALQPLRWPDMGVLGRLLQPGQSALGELATVLADFAPSLIALPALDDRHPDHGTAHVLVRQALARLDGRASMLVYRLHGLDGASARTEPAALSAQQKIKQYALAAYETQLALSGRRFRRLAGCPERHAPVEASRGGSTARALPWRPLFLLRPLLRLTAASASGEVRQWPWRKAPLQRDGQGGWRLAWPDAHPSRSCFVRLSLAWRTPWIFDHWGWCEL
ncbi:MAG: hypothetical protein RSP_19230 [Rhodanobacter sp.]